MGKKLFVKINGKTINPGFINNDGNRLTMRKKTKHIYRNLKSFGIGIPILNHLKKIGIKEIVMILVNEDKTEELFKTPIEAWNTGQLVQHGNREPQKHLTLTRLREITHYQLGKKVEIL